MNDFATEDRLETLLRDTFGATAQDAPAALRLADGARTRLRRRRRTAAGTAVAALAVAAVATTVWVAPQRTGATPSSGQGRGVVVQPQPSVTSEYCAAAEECEQSRAIDALRRPLHLPTLAPGATCPVSASHTLPQAGGFNGPYDAVGDGPFRMTGTSVVEYENPPAGNSNYLGTGWPGQKVIWSIDAAYTGPVLLRGARIDAPGGLRFDHYQDALGEQRASTAYPELAYSGDDGGSGPGIVRIIPSAVRVQSPGCYAIQVDGTTFSEIIVFRAEIHRP